MPKSQPFIIFIKIYVYIYIERKREILKFDNHDYGDRITIDIHKQLNIETP